mmetsp:Transcript_3176/g.9880  ORF Transcript_3176/g.9880 Transcript_3176/m.9880 type:complete len:212 (-) Transcript_3176:4953-5588(-)
MHGHVALVHGRDFQRKLLAIRVQNHKSIRSGVVGVYVGLGEAHGGLRRRDVEQDRAGANVDRRLGRQLQRRDRAVVLALQLVRLKIFIRGEVDAHGACERDSERAVARRRKIHLVLGALVVRLAEVAKAAACRRQVAQRKVAHRLVEGDGNRQRVIAERDQRGRRAADRGVRRSRVENEFKRGHEQIIVRSSVLCRARGQLQRGGALGGEI